MNMMAMTMMEEAIEEAWSKWPLPPRLRADAFVIYGDGFRAGSAWAMRQAKTEGSSQAVGNISQYPAAVEEPEDEI